MAMPLNTANLTLLNQKQVSDTEIPHIVEPSQWVDTLINQIRDKWADLADELNGRAQLLGIHVQLIIIHGLQLSDGAHH